MGQEWETPPLSSRTTTCWVDGSKIPNPWLVVVRVESFGVVLAPDYEA